MVKMKLNCSFIILPLNLFSAFIFFSSSPAFMVFAQNGSTTIPVNVGVVLDFDQWVGKMGLSCIDMSLSDFYASHSHYKTRIVLHIRDSQNDVVGAASAALDLIKNKEAQAILGLQTLSQAYFVIQLGEKTHVPIIFFAATNPVLSSLRSPYFIRVSQNDSSQVYAIAAIIKTFQWRQVVAIYEDSGDGFGKFIISELIEALNDINTRVSYRIAINPMASSDQIKAELHKLMMIRTTTVFIVHLGPNLASRVFINAKEIGMMSEGYVWILTDTTTNLLKTINFSVLNSMQGVLGLKTYISRTQELENFKTRWRKKFRLENPNPSIDDPQINVYGLWAYDAAWALAMAVEKIGSPIANFTDQKSNNSSKPIDLKTLGVSQNGQKLSEYLSNMKFKGLSGDFEVLNGQLQSPNFEIVNVIGDGERVVGYWTPTNGLTIDFNQTGTKLIIWPGESVKVPKGSSAINGKNVMRIGVPVKSGFTEFAKVLENGTIVGYCIDVFKAVVEKLPYTLNYIYIPVKYGSYDDLIMKVHEQQFDGAVGDITILANRSSLVQFTLPFTESGVSVVVPIRSNLENKAWLFLKPLTLDLWVTSFCFFIFMGFVVWVLEHRINEDFRGPPSNQIGISLWFSFSTMVFSQRERLGSNLARFVVLIWFFVVFILTQSYTASLTSWLTVQQLQPITDINQIIKKKWNVGYQSGSFLLEVLQLSGIKNLVTYDSVEELRELFNKGTNNGGINAAIDETPYMKLFTSKYPDDYTMADSFYRMNGFGFAFSLNSSPLVDDLSKAILTVIQSDEMSKIQKKWFETTNTAKFSSSSNGTSSSLDLSYFWSLFVIAGSASIFALIIYLIIFLRKERERLSQIDSDRNSTMWNRIIAALMIFDEKDFGFYTFRKKEDCEAGGVNGERGVEASLTIDASPRRSNVSAHSIVPSLEGYDEFDNSSPENQSNLIKDNA